MNLYVLKTEHDSEEMDTLLMKTQRATTNLGVYWGITPPWLKRVLHIQRAGKLLVQTTYKQ